MMTSTIHMTITKEKLLHDFWGEIHRGIAANAHRELFVSKYGSLTTGEANNRANVIYETLSSARLAKKKGVAIAFDDQLNAIPAVLGTWKANKHVLCLNFSNPKSRLQFQLEEAEIKIILTDTAQLSKMEKLAPIGTEIINTDELDYDQDVPDPLVEIDPDAMIQIIYTSGSTGNPKGTVEDYHYLIRALVRKCRESTSADRFTMLKGFSFPGPHTTLFGAMLTGATICYYDLQKEGIIGFSDWVRESEVTHFSMTPTMFRIFVHTLDPEERFPSVWNVKLGAEKKLRQDFLLLRKHFAQDCIFELGFAATETMSVTRSVFSLAHEFDSDILPAGVPREDIELFIWDENGAEVPYGQEGEIVIRGDSLGRGYWKNPELTKQQFIPDPTAPHMQYFRTRDLGKMLPDGQLMHLGRIDHMVKIKGIRIELDSIEIHMLAYPGIIQAASKTFEDVHGIQRLVTYFVAEQGITVPLSDLRTHLAERLSSQMLPHFLIRMEEFPLTGSGKINLPALPLPEMTRPDLPYPYAAPTGELEEKLAHIWEEEIGIAGIGVNDDFFDVGGDSLIGAMLFVSVEKKLGRKLPVSILLKAATIREQAELIREEKDPVDYEPLIPIREAGENTPLFFVSGRGGHPTRIRWLARKLNSHTPIYAFQVTNEDERAASKARLIEKAAQYIKLIRRIIPHGPYHLVGESGGGKYVFEMARQFLEQGEEVPILVLLDTYNLVQSPYEILRKFRGLSLVWMLIKKHATILRSSDWNTRRDYFNYYREVFANRLVWLYKTIRKANAKTSAPNLPVGMQQAQKANTMAMRKYIPKSYSGRVILFKALRGPNIKDATNGWDRVELGELKVHSLDCYHGGILFEPAVSQVAEILNGYIKSAA